MSLLKTVICVAKLPDFMKVCATTLCRPQSKTPTLALPILFLTSANPSS